MDHAWNLVAARTRYSWGSKTDASPIAPPRRLTKSRPIETLLFGGASRMNRKRTQTQLGSDPDRGPRPCSLLPSHRSLRIGAGRATIRGVVPGRETSNRSRARDRDRRHRRHTGRGPNPVTTKKAGQFRLRTPRFGQLEGQGSRPRGTSSMKVRCSPALRSRRRFVCPSCSKWARLPRQTGPRPPCPRRTRRRPRARSAAVAKANEGQYPAHLRPSPPKLVQPMKRPWQASTLPNHPPLLANIARSYIDEGNDAAAITTLSKKALALQPDHLDSLKMIAPLLAAGRAPGRSRAVHCQAAAGRERRPPTSCSTLALRSTTRTTWMVRSRSSTPPCRSQPTSPTSTTTAALVADGEAEQRRKLWPTSRSCSSSLRTTRTLAKPSSSSTT